MLYFFLVSDEEPANLPIQVSWADPAQRELAKAFAPEGYKSVNSDHYEGGDTDVVYEPYVLAARRCISRPSYGSSYYSELLGEEPAEVLACARSLGIDPDFHWLEMGTADRLIADLEKLKTRNDHNSHLLKKR